MRVFLALLLLSFCALGATPMTVCERTAAVIAESNAREHAVKALFGYLMQEIHGMTDEDLELYLAQPTLVNPVPFASQVNDTQRHVVGNAFRDELNKMKEEEKSRIWEALRIDLHRVAEEKKGEREKRGEVKVDTENVVAPIKVKSIPKVGDEHHPIWVDLNGEHLLIYSVRDSGRITFYNLKTNDTRTYARASKGKKNGPEIRIERIEIDGKPYLFLADTGELFDLTRFKTAYSPYDSKSLEDLHLANGSVLPGGKSPRVISYDRESRALVISTFENGRISQEQIPIPFQSKEVPWDLELTVHNIKGEPVVTTALNEKTSRLLFIWPDRKEKVVEATLPEEDLFTRPFAFFETEKGIRAATVINSKFYLVDPFKNGPTAKGFEDGFVNFGKIFVNQKKGDRITAYTHGIDSDGDYELAKVDLSGKKRLVGIPAPNFSGPAIEDFSYLGNAHLVWAESDGILRVMELSTQTLHQLDLKDRELQQIRIFNDGPRVMAWVASSSKSYVVQLAGPIPKGVK